ncbi:MFS transporter-like protein [Xylaria bambusicola]|uniref:MFS transporter-like protein n=1 Tax=Xylaria bambusicola TaxID=326684 RepID=UPI002007A3FD|nr:MFS transporter-like protein [Xylaria bambusicola]KAI0526650.1 MFS transporter-like protein [Xylaria bambusicola]
MTNEGPRASGDLPKPELMQIETQIGNEGIRTEIDRQLSGKLDHKFDRHIIPWVFGIWLFAFIDRSNIGNAKIVGLPEDLGISTGTSFNVALLVFYIPYILVDVPSNWIVKHVKAGIYLPSLITAWGLVSTFVGFTESLAGLIVARLLLGLFEGGLLGGIVVYLAMFYPRHQMLRRVGYFYCAAPLSGAFGGLLATGLSEIRYGGYNRWPWIFFIEGIVTTLFGIVCFFFMPHTPGDSKFLTTEERAAALRRMKVDSHGAAAEEDVNNEKFDWYWVRMAFKAPQLWFSCFIWFFLLVPLYSYSLFLPTIINGLGYQSTQAQLLTAPPNVAAVFSVLIMTRLSDHTKARGPYMALNCVIAAAGYVMLLASKNNAVRYAGTFIIAIGIYPNSALIMGWLSNNLAPHFVRATGIGFLIAFANTAAFIATFIYLPKDKPDYSLGHSISLGALLLCFIVCCTQTLYLGWENKKRALGDRDSRLTLGDVDRLGYRHPKFRYTI